MLEFEAFLLESEKITGDVVYLGDFNVWVDDKNNIYGRKFLEILDCFCLENLVNTPTHESGLTLDLIIVRKNNGKTIKNLEIDPVNLLSDHMLIKFKIDVEINRKLYEKIKFRLHDGQLTDKYCANLDSNMLFHIINCDHGSLPCINCVSKVFRQVSSSVFNDSCPVVEKCIKIRDQSENWYNGEIRSAKRDMRKVEKKYKKFRTDVYLNEYRALRQNKCRLVTSAKMSYVNRKIDECGNDSKKQFKFLKKLLGRIDCSYVFPSHESKFSLANDFKDHFIGKIRLIVESFDLGFSAERYFLPDIPVRKFDSFLPVSVEDTLKLVLSVNKTHCLNDPIDVRKLSFEKCHNLAIHYCDIINLSLSSGIFPESEKCAFVRPLIKKSKDQDNLDSYRPLYNTSFLSKLLEKAALSQLMVHINNFDCLPWFQSAYRQFHSVETALCKVYSDLLKVKADGGCSVLILLDLSCAFDTIDREILLDDLNSLGVTGNTYELFKSYLTGRKFRFVIGDTISDEGEITSGVPQGTILGPILFCNIDIQLAVCIGTFRCIFSFVCR